MVECDLAKVDVVGSKPIRRSNLVSSCRVSKRASAERSEEKRSARQRARGGYAGRYAAEVTETHPPLQFLLEVNNSKNFLGENVVFP